MTYGTIQKGGACKILVTDTAAIHDQTSHLATQAEIQALSLRETRVMFDTLLHVSSELRAKLLQVLDSAAWSRKNAVK